MVAAYYFKCTFVEVKVSIDNIKHSDMKTRTIIFALLLLTGSKLSFAQLNPVQNLDIYGFYGYPEYIYCPSYNCFSISWEAPDISNDTLMGFHLYKNNILWRFTDGFSVSCLGWSPCEYGDIYDSLPCYIKVKAVYNSDSLESVANDSIFIEAIAIGIKEQETNDLVLIKNPVIQGEQISLRIPDNLSNSCTIKIVSPAGQLVKEYKFENPPERIFTLQSNLLNRGFYILHLQSENKIISSKVIIE